MAVETQKGRALVLRTCNADMTAHGGFVWPKSGTVEAPDWVPTKKCGNGLHGALWGAGNGTLFNWDNDAVWQVVEIDEWIDLVGKVKFPRGVVVHTGDQKSATDYIIANGARGAVTGACTVAGDYGTATVGYGGTATAGYGGTATAGDYGTATVGYGGTATAGFRGTATAGDRGTATAGDWGTATAGNWGTATAGDWGTATAGYRSTATAGNCGTATAGRYGTIVIQHFDGERHRLAVGYVGEDGIKPNTPYRVNDKGEFVEVDQ